MGAGLGEERATSVEASAARNEPVRRGWPATAPRSREDRVQTLEHLEKAHKIASRDDSIRLPQVAIEDKTRQPAGGRVAWSKLPRAWARWFGATPHKDDATREQEAGELDRIDANTLRALPALLDGSALPNGVVELVIDDFEAPTRQLFDIHDGRIALVEPGQCVPWASISGPATAWAQALGTERDTGALELTGDTQLARRVLAAFPRPR